MEDVEDMENMEHVEYVENMENLKSVEHMEMNPPALTGQKSNKYGWVFMNDKLGGMERFIPLRRESP